MGLDAGPGIELRESEISFEFVRASGPGGQNVNKVATAVKLYFAVDRSPSLSPAIKRRLRALAGNPAVQRAPVRAHRETAEANHRRKREWQKVW